MKGFPGVVKVQRHSVAGTHHVTLPIDVMADIEAEAQDFVLFYKRNGQRDWSIRKITHTQKEQIRDAYQEDTIDTLLADITEN